MNSRSPLSRAALAAAIALAVLAGGAAVPASAAPVATGSTATAAVPAGMLGAKAKKPARVAGLRLAKGGSRNENVRVGWTWIKGVKKYEVQVATNKAFTKDTVRTVRANTNGRPAGGRLEVTVNGLKNATKYRVRVRAVAKNGTKGAWSAIRTVKTKVHIPERITALRAVPGPQPGEVRLTWKHNTRYTTHYRIELASTVFDDQGSSLPRKGRKHVRLTIPAKGKSYTIPASVTQKLGLAPTSGNHLYYRFRALNKGTAGSKLRVYPQLHAVQPRGPVALSTNGMTPLEVGTYNVVSAQVGAESNHPWTKRKGVIATNIAASGASVVGIQEVSPGDKSVYEGETRQTESLLAAVRSAARTEAPGTSYTMVRVSPYAEPGSVHGSQGQRILYDANRLELLNGNECTEYTGSRFYSPSCTIQLPLAPGDSESHRRKAAYAKFRDRQSGTAFWFVSAHLDPREGKESLRGQQAAAIVAAIGQRNAEGLPVLMTGDLNSYQNKSAGNAPHDRFVASGFVDSFTAPQKKNAAYSTYNEWKTTVKKYDQGFGVRLDYILGQNVGPFTRYVNTVAATDTSRGSDHNLVRATVYLPRR